MPAFKLGSLGPVVQLALMQAELEGDFNWQSDERLAWRLRKRFNVSCKVDDVRRVCTDLAHASLIRKLERKSIYKNGGM